MKKRDRRELELAYKEMEQVEEQRRRDEIEYEESHQIKEDSKYIYLE
jgi:hypothetical protein